MNTHQDSGKQAGPDARLYEYLYWAALAAMLCVAAFLRFHALAERSLDVDEYQVMRGVGADSVWAYLKSVLLWIPDNLPVFFFFQFLWSHLWGGGLVALQSFSTVAGIFCVFLVVILGRRTVGTAPALFAGLLAACSPIHIWFSQSLRPNSVTEMLAVLSLLLLVIAWQKGGRARWGAFMFVNLLLVWNHPMAGLLVGTEMCWLFAMGLARGRIPFRLLIPTGLIMLTPFTYIVYVSPLLQTAEDDFFAAFPSLYTILVDLFADDAVLSSEPFLFQPNQWAFLPESLRGALPSINGTFDVLLMILFALPLLFSVGWILRDMSRSGKSDWRGLLQKHQYTFLFILVIILPVAVLLAVSAVWRPLHQPRYTSYASFLLYLTLGFWIFRPRQMAIRSILCAIVILLFGWQVYLAQHCTPFVDWRSAWKHVAARLQPDDVILVKSNIYGRDNLLANVREPVRNAVLPSFTLESIAAMSQGYLRTAPNGARVWALIEFFVFPPPPLTCLEENLGARGLEYGRSDFPGMNGLYLYEIARKPESSASRTTPPVCANESYDYESLLKHLGLTPDQPQYAEALNVIRHVIDTPWPVSRFLSVFLSLALSADGRADLAERAALGSIRFGNDYPLGHFAHAVALGEKGDWPGAKAALERAIACDKFRYMLEYRRIFDALYREADLGGATSEIERLDRAGLCVPVAFRLRAKTMTLPQGITSLSGL